jgi:hypothetical protein
MPHATIIVSSCLGQATNFNCKKIMGHSIKNDNCIKVQLISIFHPTNIQPMWHGHLWLVLQLRNVVAYDDMAWSFVTRFMIKKCNHTKCFITN